MIDNLHDVPLTEQPLSISYVGFSDEGMVRTVNEDVYLVQETKNGNLFALYDGMGGHSRGKVAANTAATHISESLNSKVHENPTFALKTAIIHANQQIANLNHNKIELERMGTTAVTVLLRGRHLYHAHVGDSRLYHLRNRKLCQLTQDHTYVQQLVEGGIISEKEASSHPNRNHLTQAVGVYYDVKPSVSELPIPCVSQDLFLLCSDGLTDLVKDAQIQEIMLSSTSLQEVSEDLIDTAKHAGGEDNITVVLIRINS